MITSLGYRTGLNFGQTTTPAAPPDILDRFAITACCDPQAGTDPQRSTPTSCAPAAPGAMVSKRSGKRASDMTDEGVPEAPYERICYGVTTEAESRHGLSELAAQESRHVKIWVDDRNGTVRKLKPNLLSRDIDEPTGTKSCGWRTSWFGESRIC